VASRSFAQRWWRRLLLVATVALVTWLGWEAVTWPDVGALARIPPTTTAFIERYKERERAAGRTPRPAFAWTPYAAISPDVKRAVLVAEDINFFTHHGFDWGEIKHAIEENLGDRDTPRGASTISQQLVKNLWLSPGRSPLRKVKEAILTWQLERTLSKRRILELYLNVVELGPGIYGVGPAARAYFGKPAADLGEDEAALLAASLPRPRSWHPGSKSRAYERYAATIRSRMTKAEFLLKQI
jgi:monofunctional biosynthetic peptidoglycan transglycosylase